MTQLGEFGTVYDAAFKAECVKMCVEGGQSISAVAKAKGCGRSSVARWLEEAGHDPTKIAKEAIKNQQGAAAASSASRKQQAEAGKERLSRAFMAVAELSARIQIEQLQPPKDGQARPELPKGVKFADVVQAGNKALHDFLLLNGDDTERQSYRPSHQQVAEWRDELKERRAQKAMAQLQGTDAQAAEQ